MFHIPPKRWRRWWLTTFSRHHAKTGSTETMPTCAPSKLRNNRKGRETPAFLPRTVTRSVLRLPVLGKFLRLGDLLGCHLLFDLADFLPGIEGIAVAAFRIGRRQRQPHVSLR